MLKTDRLPPGTLEVMLWRADALVQWAVVRHRKGPMIYRRVGPTYETHDDARIALNLLLLCQRRVPAEQEAMPQT